MDWKNTITPARVILALLIIFTLSAMIFSNRPWRGYTSPWIEDIATLPDNDRLAPVRRYTEIGAGVIFHIGGRRPEFEGYRAPLKLGYAYHEYGILGMPYWVGDEYGLVTYIETPEGRQYAGIAPGQIPLLDEMMGEPIASTYRFRWWLQIWGWIFPILLVALVFAWLREGRIREEEHWAS